MDVHDPLLAPMKFVEHQQVGGVEIDTAPAGEGRVKRVVYPPGFRWSTHMKAVVGTDWCMHGHVGFLARGRVHIQYADGCTAEFSAPQVVTIEPGHDGWVEGPEPAVFIEFDFERETCSRFGIRNHSHA